MNEYIIRLEALLYYLNLMIWIGEQPAQEIIKTEAGHYHRNKEVCESAIMQTVQEIKSLKDGTHYIFKMRCNDEVFNDHEDYVQSLLSGRRAYLKMLTTNLINLSQSQN